MDFRKRKIAKESREKIFEEYTSTDITQSELAKKYNVKQSSINQIIHKIAKEKEFFTSSLDKEN